MADLTKLKRKRTTKKNIVVRELLPECERILLEDKTQEHCSKAEVLLNSLKEQSVAVMTLDEKVSEETVEDDAYEENEKASYEFVMRVRKMEAKLRTFLTVDLSQHWMTGRGLGSDHDEGRSESRKVGVKLPKIKIKTFTGDAIKWQAFIEAFDATIHERDDLSNVEKFTYLKGFLSDSALQSIEGMPLTSSNYEEAKAMLEKRYGNSQLIISSHMNSLLKLDKVVGANAKQLRELNDKVEIHIRALKTAGVGAEHFGALLIPIVLEKLPNVIRLQISRKLGSDNWNITEFMATISEEVSARENFEYLKSCDEQGDDETKSKMSTTSSLTVFQNTRVCVFCGDGHYSDKCDVITDINLRKEKLRELKCCYRCLKKHHVAKNCRKNVNCYRCKAKNRHNTAICDKEIRNSNTTVAGGDKSVLLQTANGYVFNEGEKKCEMVKILLDSCSQQTFVTEKIVKKLGLKSTAEVDRKINAFGCGKGTEMKLKEYSLVLKPMDQNTSIYVKALAVPEICAPIHGQDVKSAVEQNDFLKILKLADSGNVGVANAGVLIGADVYWNIVSGNLKKNSETGLVAISSAFGWLINGPINEAEKPVSVNMTSSHVLRIQCEKSEKDVLDEGINRFWRLDLLGIAEEEDLSENHNMGNIAFEKGRYVVDLPFKEGHPPIADNFTLCKKRLETLKIRLDRNEELKRKYDGIIKEQLEAGVIEKVDGPGVIGAVTYLPHREVIRNDKSTTKVRVVYDGSAKRKGQVSLNEMLHKGPSLNPNLFNLLLKFRIHKIAITADIEKAYLQVVVKESHRDFLRFLWYADVFAKNSEIEVYRFCRVMFGITPSQYLLNAAIRKHASKYEAEDSEFVRKVRNHFYVDDLSTGVSSVIQGKEIYDKVKIRFMEAQFNVRKWRTNSTELRDLMSEEDISQENNAKVLGIKWNHAEDVLQIGVKEVFEEADKIVPTKRNILKIIASIYDPIGYLAPITVNLKLLFQEICLTKIEWDGQIGDELVKKWVSVVKMLRTYADMCIGRCYFIDDLDDPIEKIYLHGYSDAAEKVFASCVYIQSVTRSSKIHVSLVAAKSRVKPMHKQLSMPKMELLGNFILSKLIKIVYDTLLEEIKIDDYFCWTDSMVALAWINADSRVFKVFVQNRVKEIRRNTDANKWGYCSTKANPADYITRFSSGNPAECKSWLNGPIELKDANSLLRRRLEIIEKASIDDDLSREINKESRPNCDNDRICMHLSTTLKVIKSEDNEGKLLSSVVKESSNNTNNSIICMNLTNNELNSYYDEIALSNNSKQHIIETTLSKSDRILTTCMSSNSSATNSYVKIQEIDNLIDIAKFSNTGKLMRITAWVLRFIANSRTKNSDRNYSCYISTEERRVAFNMWLKVNQRSLLENANYEHMKSLLNLLEGEDGIIRAHGRIGLACIPETSRTPIMLERSHRLAELLLWDSHIRVKHNGVRESLNEFHSMFWVTKGKSFAKKVLHRCLICKLINSRPYSYPKSPELPEVRFKDDYAFAATGIDHFGHLYCKNNFTCNSVNEDDMHKCFVLLYTCAASRSVILDLVPDTSAKEVINSLKRLIARRGCPKEILSDRGGSFVAAETQSFASERNVKWSFSLTKAPWYGAIWERLVQSAKKCLKKVVGQTTLTFLELQTVLMEIEAIMNSRPLCSLFDDDLEEPLTPNHMLFGRMLSQNNQSQNSDVVAKPSPRRARYIETVVNHYWERWRKEYVITLRNWKSKYKRSNALVPKVDDVVLVYEEKIPRQRWCIGRVIETIPSRDGQIRGAKIFVGKSKAVIERPINKLYPLELANEVESRNSSSKSVHCSNTVEIVNSSNDYEKQRNTNSFNTVEIVEKKMNKRKAAILADKKLKHMK